MKNLYLLLLVAFASVTLFSCGGNDDEPVNPENNTENGGENSGEDNTVVPKPTDWKLPGDLHYSSMTVVVDQDKLPIGVEVAEDDLLGAFVDDECRGAVAPVGDIDGKSRFYLVVHATASDTNREDMQVQLRYYSAKQSHIYIAKPLAFEYNGCCGSFENSYAPIWQ